MSFEDALEIRVKKCYKYNEVQGTRGHKYRQCRRRGPRIPPYALRICPEVLPWMSAGAFLTVSSQELLVIFNRKLLHMLHYIGSVVQSYITLTP